MSRSHQYMRDGNEVSSEHWELSLPSPTDDMIAPGDEWDVLSVVPGCCLDVTPQSDRGCPLSILAPEVAAEIIGRRYYVP